MALLIIRLISIQPIIIHIPELIGYVKLLGLVYLICIGLVYELMREWLCFIIGAPVYIYILITKSRIS